MITIISGTNRKDSLTKVFAEKYCQLISQISQEPVQLLALEDVSHEWFTAQMYDGANQHQELAALQDQYVKAASAFVIFAPEYNGSFPGALKSFIDACSVRDYLTNFKNKKVALVGTASGRAGNLRGIGQLAAIFNHMGAHTMPNQLPLSSIKNAVENNEVTGEEMLKTMQTHAEQFLDFAF